MDNLTPTEYDRFVAAHGVRHALDSYPYTMSYRYATPQTTAAGQVLGHHEWTMFYGTEADRAKHAGILRTLGGTITGASGGDTSRVHNPQEAK